MAPPRSDAAGTRADQHSSAGRDAYTAAGDLHVHLDRAQVAHTDALGVLPPPSGRLPLWVRGRDTLLGRLHALVAEPDRKAHLLSGMGGVGKSTVALHVAEAALRAGRPAWWVPASDASALTSSLMGLALALGSPPGEVDAALAGRLDASDVLWRQLEQRSGWLLVLDNADDVAALALAERTARDGNGWLRPSVAGSVLVTSRDSDTRHWGRHVELHRVAWLAADDGAQILLDLAPRGGSRPEARRLSERLGGLPLALHQAGAHLASLFVTERTFTGFTNALDDQFHSVLGTGPDEREIVTRTFDVSLRQIAHEGVPHARALLATLAHFSPGALVPLRLLDRDILRRVCPGRDASVVQRGLEALQSVGLIEVRSGSDAHIHDWTEGIAIHPLVAEVARHQRLHEASTCDSTSAPHMLARDLLGAVSPGNPEDAKDWPNFDRLTVHVEALATCPAHPACKDYSDAAGFRLQALAQARYLYSSGQSSRARDLADRLRINWTITLGEEHSDTLTALNRLGAALTHLDQNTEARDIFSALCTVRTRLLGPHHPDSLAAGNNLGVALKELQDYPAARDVLQETTANQAAVLGPDSPATLRSACNLGEVLVFMMDHRAAHEVLTRVHARRTSLLGAEHPDTLWTAHYLALALHGLGTSRQAHTMLFETLRAHERVLGMSHPDTLAVGSSYAELVHDLGDRPPAIALMRSVHDGQQRVLGEQHAAVRRTARKLSEWTGAGRDPMPPRDRPALP
jgi:tetratricopeptide repeat protein/NB-ARC domain-containing protein